MIKMIKVTISDPNKVINNKYFQKNNGKDHIFLLSHYQFSHWNGYEDIPMSICNELILPEYWNRLQNSTCTRYERYRMSKWENMYKSNPKICFPKSLFEVYW